MFITIKKMFTEKSSNRNHEPVVSANILQAFFLWKRFQLLNYQFWEISIINC